MTPGTVVRVRLDGLEVEAVVGDRPARDPAQVFVFVPACAMPWWPGERLVRREWLLDPGANDETPDAG